MIIGTLLGIVIILGQTAYQLISFIQIKDSPYTAPIRKVEETAEFLKHIKIMTTKIKQTTIAIILTLSVAGNCWYFGSKELEKYKQEIFNQGVIFVFQQVNYII